MEALSSIFVFGLLVCHTATASVARRKFTWLPTIATWYGEAEGDGSSGGACGYKALVEKRPFKGRVAAVSDVLFLNGVGCGACYKIRCFYKVCAARPATVIIIDQSPGGQTTHFDLGGRAMGHMAKKGMESELRNIGYLEPSMVRYTRVKCGYRGRKITFTIPEGSTGDWLSLLVAFINGDGVIESMQISDQNCETWHNMYHVWGAIHAVSGPGQGPFSVRITSNNQTITAYNVIPADWSINMSYSSDVNF